MPVVQVAGNEIQYGDTGSGTPIVFVHGLFLNGAVWDEVVARLADRFRCITPDLPLGGHSSPVRPGTDLGPKSVAAMLVQFLDALDLRDVTVVGNDTGGALILIALDSGEPGLDRVSRLVLTNCDSYENFPPRAMRGMVSVAKRVPPLATSLLARTTRTKRARSRYLRASTHRTEIPAVINAAFDRLHNVGVRRDAVRFIAGLHRSVALGAAGAIGTFPRPVLLAWGMDDEVFPAADARRLAHAFPKAVLIEIPQSKTYVMIDAPDRLAQLISEFDKTSRADLPSGGPESEET